MWLPFLSSLSPTPPPSGRGGGSNFFTPVSALTLWTFDSQLVSWIFFHRVVSKNFWFCFHEDNQREKKNFDPPPPPSPSWREGGLKLDKKGKKFSHDSMFWEKVFGGREKLCHLIVTIPETSCSLFLFWAWTLKQFTFCIENPHW